MSVGPVQPGSAGIERPTPVKKVPAATHPVQASPAKSPKVETPKPQNSSLPSSSLFPEHEVTVQGDTPEDNILIYKILDKQSGSLVLQVPSAEVLNDVHQTQELLQRIISRSKAATPVASSEPAVKGEEKNNGNKL
jgi:hypothetical protein